MQTQISAIVKPNFIMVNYTFKTTSPIRAEMVNCMLQTNLLRYVKGRIIGCNVLVIVAYFVQHSKMTQCGYFLHLQRFCRKNNTLSAVA